MPRTTFGTAINCFDGRVQIPVIMWMREVLSLEYVDLITQPGADAVVADDANVADQLVRPRVELSITRHASPVLTVVGHFDCLANPVEESEHRAQLRRAVRALLQCGTWVSRFSHCGSTRTGRSRWCRPGLHSHGSLG